MKKSAVKDAAASGDVVALSAALVDDTATGTDDPGTACFGY